MALATGLTASIFTLVYGILLRPLPYPASTRLVRLFESNIQKAEPRADVSVPNFVDWRQSSDAFEIMAPVASTSYTLSGAADPEQVNAALVTRAFFELLGQPLVLGRPFEDSDYASSANAGLGVMRRATPGGSATVILSHDLWHRQFGGDPNVVGRPIRLEGRPATVVGVMPEGFGLDEALGNRADCFLPLSNAALASRSRQFRHLAVIARLSPGRDIAAAQTMLDVVAARLEREYPKTNTGWAIRVLDLHDSLVGDKRRTLLVLLGASACVLLIGFANIANLMLVLAVRRSREFAVRMALGATRARVLRQWLTEQLVISMIGGSAGFVVAILAVPILITYAPLNLPRLASITVDARMLAFSLLVSVGGGLACGLVARPWSTPRWNQVRELRTTGTSSVGGRRRYLRQGLIVAGVALTVVLLVGGGLMMRSLLALQAVDLGFNPARILTFGVDPKTEHLRAPALYDKLRLDLVNRLQALPGVEAAGVGSVPFVGSIDATFHSDADAIPLRASVDAVSPGYLRALGIRQRHGRLFESTDDASAQPVAIVSRSFARVAWGTEEVVGRRMRVGDKSDAWLTVVGVVDDVRMSGPEILAPHVVYLPFLQSQMVVTSNFVVRTAADPSAVIPFVRRAVNDLAPDQAVVRLATLEKRLGDILAPRLFNLWLIGLFSLTSLSVALVGLYGFVTETLASRTSELGLRIALGARPAQVAGFVAREGLGLVAIGVALGLGVASALNRVIASLLFSVGPTDPAAYLGAGIVCILAGAAACSLPLKRVWRVDPVAALRAQ